MAYQIIGSMTGNSMDAIDLVLTEFDGEKMTDICSYSKPYGPDMRLKMQTLRKQAFAKSKQEIELLPDFRKIHDAYIRQIADAINEMCEINSIDKQTVDAIGFHGKTLDHNPPSKAKIDGSEPYTLQIGSGQMLADLTGIKVVYDFRSDFVMKGLEGAPLVGPHNAHIAKIEGDGCYYNGGNTSNFAIIQNGKCVLSSDAGPFNEYVDAYVRTFLGKAFDEDGQIGRKGSVDEKLLQHMFSCCKNFYEAKLPKSGDPAYYHQDEIFKYVEINGISFENAVRTFEYASAYIAAYSLCLVDKKIKMPSDFILFGGGWKNPIVKEDFENLLERRGLVLADHQKAFEDFTKRMQSKPQVRYSNYGTFMEARLMADMARFKLENKPWDQKIVAGVVAEPQEPRDRYDDCFSRAAKN